MEMTVKPEKRGKIHYAWIVALGAILMSFFCQASSSPNSQYVSFICEELGFTRAAFMISFSLNSIMSMLMTLFYGPISRKLGVRRIIFIGLCLETSALLINSVAKSIYLFYITGAMFGIAMSCLLIVTCSVLINNWFAVKHGMLIGILLAAGSTGGAFYTQVAVRVINAYGWRFSYRVSAIIVILVAIPAMILIRNKPSDMGLEPFGIESVRGVDVKKVIEKTGIMFKDALKTPRFWLGFFGILFIGTCVHPVFANLPAYVTDSGFNTTVAGLVSGIAFISAAVCKIFLGGIYDRKGIVPLVVFTFSGFIIAALLLQGTMTDVTVYIIPFIFGVSLCAVTMVAPLYVATVFGRKDYASFSGVFVALIRAGTAIGNPIMGAVYDNTGSYKPCILAFFILACIALALVLLSLRGKRYVAPGEEH